MVVDVVKQLQPSSPLPFLKRSIENLYRALLLFQAIHAFTPGLAPNKILSTHNPFPNGEHPSSLVSVTRSVLDLRNIRAGRVTAF